MPDLYKTNKKATIKLFKKIFYAIYMIFYCKMLLYIYKQMK